MAEPALVPGEAVRLSAAPDPGRLRGRWLAIVAIFALLMAVLGRFLGPMTPALWASGVAVYAAGTAALVWGVEARRRWTLTDRRLIAPDGDALALPVRLSARWRGLTATGPDGRAMLLRDQDADGPLARALRGRR